MPTEITIPYNWTAEKHQLPILRNKARFKVLVWHRKAHKTTLAINELIRRAMLERGTYWYIFPYYNQAKKVVWLEPEMLPKYVPPMIWDKRNNTDQYITFPNGSVLHVMGADHPDSLRGPNPRGVVLDEYGDMKSEIWQGIVQPIMIANPNAWCWFIGTPKGQNDFYAKYIYARDHQDPSWMCSLLTAQTTGIISPEGLLEAQRTTTQAFFKQEYECAFLEGAGAFFTRVNENTWEPDDRHHGHVYQLGVDLAKYQDWTVLTPFCLSCFKAHRQERFNQIDWNIQKARIEATARRYNNARIVVDSTGIGDPITEDLIRQGLAVEPFKFTEMSRRQILDNLSILLTQDKIKIPDDPGLIEELNSMMFTIRTTDSGKPKVHVEVPSGVTDDRIMSLALAVREVTEPLGSELSTQEYGLYSSSYN